MPHFIYALTDPHTDAVFYVGLTDNFYERFKQHIGCYGRNIKLNEKIKGLIDEGLLPAFKILEIIEHRIWAFNREVYWIDHYIGLGVPLLNIKMKGEETRKQGHVVFLQRKDHVPVIPHSAVVPRVVGNASDISLTPLSDFDRIVMSHHVNDFQPAKERVRNILEKIEPILLEEKNTYTLRELVNGLPYSDAELGNIILLPPSAIEHIRIDNCIGDTRPIQVILAHLSWIYRTFLSDDNVRYELAHSGHSGQLIRGEH